MKNVKCADCNIINLSSYIPDGWTCKNYPYFEETPKLDLNPGELLISKMKWRTEFYCKLCSEKREIRVVFG